MRHLVLGGAGLAAVLAGPAMAADMPVRAPAPAVAYYDWSGAYAGFNVGAAWYDVTHHFTTPGAITPDVTTSDRDGIFGFHAGAVAVGCLGARRGSGAKRMLPGVPQL